MMRVDTMVGVKEGTTRCVQCAGSKSFPFSLATVLVVLLAVTNVDFHGRRPGWIRITN